MSKTKRTRKAPAAPATPKPDFTGSGVINVKALTFGRISLSGVIDIPTQGKCFIAAKTIEPNDQFGEIWLDLIVPGEQRQYVGVLKLPRNKELTRDVTIAMTDGRQFRCTANFHSFVRATTHKQVKRFKLGVAGYERPAV